MATSQVEDQHRTDPHHESSVKSYLVIFLILMVLLGLTIAAAFVDFHHPVVNFGIAATIAITKGTLIILYFMHVKHGPKRVVIFAAGGFLWLGLMIVLFMVDYGTRNPEHFANPKGEPRFVQYEGSIVPPTGHAHGGESAHGGHHGPEAAHP